jgi:hypothetical protein
MCCARQTKAMSVALWQGFHVVIVGSATTCTCKHYTTCLFTHLHITSIWVNRMYSTPWIHQRVEASPEPPVSAGIYHAAWWHSPLAEETSYDRC